MAKWGQQIPVSALLLTPGVCLGKSWSSALEACATSTKAYLAIGGILHLLNTLAVPVFTNLSVYLISPSLFSRLALSDSFYLIPFPTFKP